jgi:Cu(I)/Ag(I) efflux system membrane fusion protein
MSASTTRRWRIAALIAALMIVAFGIGYILRGSGRAKPAAGTAQAGSTEQEQEVKAEFWTCSMHPQVHQPGPGKCPICGMDLIPVYPESAEELGPRQIKLSEYAIKLAEIETAPVERRFVSAEVRMVGKVEYDETRLGTITARFPGRLDRLFVDYTGIPVRQGDHLVSIYSPELLTAQEELLQALRTVRELEAGGSTDALASARRVLDAVREKLSLWDLTVGQIAAIEKRGTPSDQVTIYAPMGGIVIHKHAVEGMYVQTGTPIYTIADLSRVWIKLDAYESDLPWVRYGQQVAFETEAFPGETFTGTIAFVDPVLDAKTRTVNVRVNVPNPNGKLKPGMFVRGLVRATLAEDGHVVSRQLAGKWMCPMHPEIVKDGPGACDICGMPLVRAETLGYVSDAERALPPLVVPASAPLVTGKRAVVYVAVPDKPGTFEGREIVLGPRASDYYVVMSGLAEGERVVVEGNFKIDSAVQILAKPSMMQPTAGTAPIEHAAEQGTGGTKPIEVSFTVPEAFKAQLGAVYSAYFATQQALSRDNLAGAKDAAGELVGAIGRLDMTLLGGPEHTVWMRELEGTRPNAERLAAAAAIEDARAAFALLSESVYAMAKRFGASGPDPVLRFHCPMAFNNRGADWLQNKEGVENPYFGAQMPTCGEQVEIVYPGTGETRNDHE